MSEQKEKIKNLSVNKKARFNYSIEETLECGVILAGTEVKSLRQNKFSYSDSYCKIENGSLLLVSFHISVYDHGNIHNHDPDRERVLLAHKNEIKKLQRKVSEKGYTLIPVRIYLKNGKVKIEVGICKGKKVFDKRETIKDRDTSREMSREIKNYK